MITLTPIEFSFLNDIKHNRETRGGVDGCVLISLIRKNLLQISKKTLIRFKELGITKSDFLNSMKNTSFHEVPSYFDLSFKGLWLVFIYRTKYTDEL